MSKEKKRMKKAEKECTYVCDVCGCEIMCTTPSRGPLVCCDEVMYCCWYLVNNSFIYNLPFFGKKSKIVHNIKYLKNW